MIEISEALAALAAEVTTDGTDLTVSFANGATLTIAGATSLDDVTFARALNIADGHVGNADLKEEHVPLPTDEAAFPNLGAAGFTTTPLVFSQVISEPGAYPVVTRLDNVSETGFSLRLQLSEVAESAGAAPLPNSAGFIAFEDVPAPDMAQQTVTGGVDHQFTGKTFETSFAAPPALLASRQTFAGINLAWLRMDSLPSTGVQLKVEEETTLDAEVPHVDEEVKSPHFIRATSSPFRAPTRCASAKLETSSSCKVHVPSGRPAPSTH